jgi:ABC-type lipoprotein release transport system permease subunit
MLVPMSYSLRSLFVRRSATALTVLGIGATVAVLGGVLALRQGFQSLFLRAGRDDVAVFLRPGATSENQSFFRRGLGDRLIKTCAAIAPDPDATSGGAPLASMECSLAVRRYKIGGTGREETNVPIRGVQPATFRIYDQLRIAEGRRFEFGHDEVVVGRKLVERIQNCRLGDVVQLNVTPFKVVGIFECEGPFESEIWGDFERMSVALDLQGPTRVVARLKPGVIVKDLAKELESDKETPATVMTDREYLASQTAALGTTLEFLSIALSVIMGIAAVFTATNTMLAAVAGRTHEIGVLLSVGFRPVPIFLAFLFEAVLLGLVGGAVGCLLALPVNGIETGTTNWNTFTEVAFAFRVTPDVLATAVIFSLVLGLLGGAIPAWRAARLEPTEAMRRR